MNISRDPGFGKPGRGTLRVGRAGAIVAICALPLAARAQKPAAETPEQTVEITRAALKEYYATERLISKERSDWALAKEILQSRIAMARDQIAELKAKITEEEGKITEADTEREASTKTLDGLKEIEGMQRERLIEAEARVRKLAGALPEVLKAKLQPLFERLPAEGKPEGEIAIGISQRFQNVLGILNEVNKFNGDIALSQERRAIAGGQEAEMPTLYIGLGQAFYAGSDATGGEAGRATPTTDGYRWEPDPEAAPAINGLVKVYSGEKMAEFVPVNIAIQ
jgi:hypothetical protein